jgi:hypothetical protein
MAMATSTFSPRPASLRPLRAGGKPVGLLPFPRRLACATASGEAPPVEQRDEAEPALAAASNGAAVKSEAPPPPPAPAPVPAFRDARWVNGTWDLAKFDKGSGVDWDAVIDAGEGAQDMLCVNSVRHLLLCCNEWDGPLMPIIFFFLIPEARRRRWLEDYPEATNTDEAVVFATSIIPWWAWMKRFHLPEAEKLNGMKKQLKYDAGAYGVSLPSDLACIQNRRLFSSSNNAGRAAMVGFFMAYFVDSLTGAGLVDQMGNFFCKTLLFAAVAGVLLVRKNEDVESLKKLVDETTFYDRQWQATWQDDSAGGPNN